MNLAATKKNIKVTSVNSDQLDRNSFASSIASGWDSGFWSLVILGTGMASSQSGGNGIITSGTTANAETIYRHPQSVIGNCVMRYKTTLSQRIVNQTIFYELVDVIGDDLVVIVNNATSITVTFPASFPISSANVGQSMSIGDIVGISGAIPGRYAIASVSGQNANFTVAGWPASGSGTCSAFGWNGFRFTYDGATATSAKFDSYRNGYGSGDTTITINTTAAPGHVSALFVEDGFAYALDAAPNTTVFTQRAQRSENIASVSTQLYFQIRVLNGSTAPASSTTVTTGFAHLNEWDSSVISISRQPGTTGNNTVNVASMPPVAIASGTITSVTTVITSGTPTAPANPYFLNSAATTNGNLILTGTSGVQAFYASNIGATAAFVKLYNKATAPTVGTDIPEMVIPVPAAIAGVPGFVEITPGYNGYRFALGLGIAITGGSADSDTTAIAAGQVKVKLSRTA
jgi:hypothetical protein